MRRSITLAAAAAIIAIPSLVMAQGYGHEGYGPEGFVTAPLNSAVAIAGEAIAVPGMLLTGRSAAYAYSPYGYYGSQSYHATKPVSLEMHPSGPTFYGEY